jgi:ABC-type transport system substrate-binding protein
LLRTAGLAAGAAGLAAMGCSGGSKPGPASSPGGASATPTPTPGPQTPSPTPRSGKHGETLRYTGYVQRDAFADPHRTQAGPFYGQQALVFSRLLTYADQAQGTIVADLAERLPEMPDRQTLVFRIKPGARWQDLPPLNGREVTAEDVKHSIERQLSGDTTFVRAPQWSAIDSIEVSDPRTITFKLKEPRATMQHRFADVNSFIVAPELSEGSGDIGLQRQIGSGPFQWVEWSDEKFASVRRNPGWFGGDERPYLDGMSLIQPATTVEVEAGLRTKDIDVAFVGRALADRLKRSLPDLVENTVGHSLFFGVRFSLVNAPYNDLRFRSALTIALDRRGMIDQFFGGAGGLNPWISWPVSRWTLPESELTSVPGYRPGAGGRAEDLREAKALLDAFLSEKKLPEGGLPLLVLDTAEAAIGMGRVIAEQLALGLGIDVKVFPVDLGRLSSMLLSAEAPFAAGPDTGWIDLDDWVYPYFHSSGTKNSFPLVDKDLDALIDAQRIEFDTAKRQQIGYEIQRRLLALNAGVNLVSERVVTLSWPYVKGFPLDTADGYQDRLANCWIDRSDPTFRGRR